MDADYELEEIEEKLIEIFGIEYYQFQTLIQKLDPLLGMAISPITEQPFIGFGTGDMWIAKKPYKGFVNQVLIWMGAQAIRDGKSNGFSKTITHNGEPEFQIVLTKPEFEVQRKEIAEKKNMLWDYLKEHLSAGREVCITKESVMGHIVLSADQSKKESDKSDKGDFEGTCNITACSTGLPATWYNHSTRKYYCESCASRLNVDEFNRRDAQRMFGHDLCTPGKQEEVENG